MSDLKLNSSWELELADGKLSLTTGKVATAQRLGQKLKMFYGEWFLERSKGVPYFQQILIKNPNPTVVNAVLKRELIEDEAVEEIRKFELSFDGPSRGCQLDFDVKTDEGLFLSQSVSLP